MRRILLCLALALVCGEARAQEAGRVVVGSKNFSESRLLGEMFARLLEGHTDLRVERRLGLAGTAVCFRALKDGDIHVYPEYTGTGLVTLLEMPPGGSSADVLTTVRREFRRRFDVDWLAPLGFENAYEVAVRRAVAEARGLASISDLAAVAGDLTAGFGYEFTQREDGLVGLRRAYGLEFGKVVNMQQALKYEAAGAGRLDALDVYTTDGRILVHDLVVLQDERGVFPPYSAAPLVHGPTLRRHPEVGTALGLLAGLLDEKRMRRLNYRVEVDGEALEAVAQGALEEMGIVGAGAGRTVSQASRGGRSLLSYMWASRQRLARYALQHLGLVVVALTLAVVLAVPLGLLLERRRGVAEGSIRGVGVLQTIPSIALLAFMIPPFGVGARPAIAALFLYALYPIVRNTYTGVRDAAPAAVESALALGMTPRQTLLHVRLPLAAPVILTGVRTSAVISVGTATLAAFIGAGGLGEPIVSGLQLNDTNVILSGAIPAALMALGVDGMLAGVERWVRPRG